MTVETADAGAMTSAVGRTQEEIDLIALAPARRLAATFDRAPDMVAEGGALPPGWHWLYFLDAPPTAELGSDGRTTPHGFLPDTGLPRRMWAGGSFVFHRPLRIGEVADCVTAIADIRRKEGRSGALVFITTEHRVSQQGRLAIEERRNLVFRAPPQPGETPRREPVPSDSAWRRELVPDSVLLFRFSALTFNAHRIHYDEAYCREEEGYPGLVVHGPMLALLLLDLVGRECTDRTVARFEYRAVAPLFAGAPLAVCGRPVDGGAELWIEGADGTLATTATATFA